jgi:hypothetical protein
VLEQIKRVDDMLSLCSGNERYDMSARLQFERLKQQFVGQLKEKLSNFKITDIDLSTAHQQISMVAEDPTDCKKSSPTEG